MLSETLPWVVEVSSWQLLATVNCSRSLLLLYLQSFYSPASFQRTDGDSFTLKRFIQIQKIKSPARLRALISDGELVFCVHRHVYIGSERPTVGDVHFCSRLFPALKWRAPAPAHLQGIQWGSWWKGRKQTALCAKLSFCDEHLWCYAMRVTGTGGKHADVDMRTCTVPLPHCSSSKPAWALRDVCERRIGVWLRGCVWLRSRRRPPRSARNRCFYLMFLDHCSSLFWDASDTNRSWT